MAHLIDAHTRAWVHTYIDAGAMAGASHVCMFIWTTRLHGARLSRFYLARTSDSQGVVGIEVAVTAAA